MIVVHRAWGSTKYTVLTHISVHVYMVWVKPKLRLCIPDANLNLLNDDALHLKCYPSKGILRFELTFALLQGVTTVRSVMYLAGGSSYGK